MARAICLALATAAMLATSVAGAKVVTWTLDGEFDDGGVAKGFFTLTDTPSIGLDDYAIQVSGGDFSDFEYTPTSAPGELPSRYYVLFDSQGGRSLGVYFFPGALWDENGSLICCVTYLLDTSISFEGLPSSPIRLFSVGASVASVPEPSTCVLLALGLVVSITALKRVKGSAVQARGGEGTASAELPGSAARTHDRAMDRQS